MTHGPVPAPRERGWIRMTLALAAFLLLPHVPELSAFVPVIDTLVLLTPVLAACFVVGWWAGGPLSLAILWTGMAAWLLSLAPPTGAGAAYYDLARAWGLVVAGAFGRVCIIGRQRSFLERALSAIVVAALLAYEQSLVRADDLSQVKRAFDLNGYVGILYLAATALAVYIP